MLHQLEMSPYLVMCLCHSHPTTIQDVLGSNIATWGPFLVEPVATHDVLLVDALQQQTEL
jgi:hypothetical protein